MSVIFIAPGKAMRTGTGRVALWRALRTATAGGNPPGPSVPDPGTISGIAGWWDAGDFAGSIDTLGQPLRSWGQTIAAVANKIDGSQPLTTYVSASVSTVMAAVPRLAGLKGGVGGVVQGTTTLTLPALSPYHGLSYGGPGTGSAGDWTWWIVWSRPNWRQGTNIDGQPSTLLAAGQIPLLQIDNKNGSGRLTLFPSGANVSLSTTLTRRHTHSLVLRNSGSTGVDAWLDGILVARGVVNPLPPSPTGPTYLLHDGTPLGGAQCWFHEAATWRRALPDGEIQTLSEYARRWPTGKRRGVTVVMNGQSNAINYALNDGAGSLLAQGMAWYVGAAAYNVVASTGAADNYTMQSGHGLYPAVGGAYPGSFLNPPGAGADPAAWPLGTDGLAVRSALQNLGAEDREDICAFVWPWNETDSLRDYGEKITFSAAVKRFITLERAMVGDTAARVPLIWWNAIPYGSSGGMQMHREVTAELAADPTINVVIGNPQTADSNPRGSLWDPATGIFTGGDAAHRDGEDNRRFARLAAIVAARALLAEGQGDTLTTLPNGLPVVGGPRIVHVFRQSDTSLILTIAHDGGNDIKVPLRAGSGIGFSVMDGGTMASPGNMVSATSCQKLDAAHLLLTLEQPLRNPSTRCGLYYPYGSGTIGRGNVITDNQGSIERAGGWNIGSDLGSGWTLDYPLAATARALPLNDVPA